MADAVKVRLVRCPKCANLLTELPDFSLYKCGGCGAVLKAKKKRVLKDGLTERSDDVQDVRTSGECNVFNMSNIDVGSIDGSERGIIEKYDNERVTSIGSSMSRFENGASLPDFNAIQRGKERTRRPGYYDDENKSYAQNLVRRRNRDEFSDSNINMPEYGNFLGEQRRFGSFPYHDAGPSSYETSSHYEHSERTRFRDRGLHGFARIEKLEHDRVELLTKLDELKDQLNRSWDMDRRPNERMVSPIPPDSYVRLHNSYVQEGLNSSYGIANMSLSANDLESPHLRHIDEYNPHTSRFVSGMRDSYSPWGIPPEFGGFRPSRQSPSWIMHQPYHEDVHGYYSDTNVDHMLHQPRHFLYPPNPILHVSQGFGSGGSTLHTRQSPTLNSADLDYESESFGSHQHRKVEVAHRRGRLCHPILGGAPFITCCNCFELLKLPRKHLLLAEKQKMKCGSCFSVILFELGSKGYVVSVSSHGDPISKDVDVGSNKPNTSVRANICEVTDKSDYGKPERQLDLSSSTIPVNKQNTQRNKKTNFDGPKKQLQPLSAYSSISVNEHNMANKANSNDPEKLIDRTNKSKYDGFGKQLDSLSSMSSCSVDQHYMETDNKSSDESKKHIDPLSALSTVSVGNHDTDTDKKSNYDESEKQVDTHFASPSISPDEHIIDTDKKYDDESEKQLDTHFTSPSISTDKHITDTDKKYDDESEKQLDTHCTTPSISMRKHITDDVLNSEPEKQLDPLSATDAMSEKHYYLPEECHVHCSGNNISSQFDDGDENKRSDPALDHPSQISANDSAMAAENGASVNAFSDRHVSNYSWEISEEDYPHVNIKDEPFIGVTEESSHDFSDYYQSLEYNESKVYVNGHFIPNHDVMKAEKLAGPIQPGVYWYDIRAGFWGVMGRPCLGIIMPNIQEFNYPLPDNCAAGNTGVLVNGRELHQKDLDILAARGLPILKYGSYIIQISGKVVDVHTGEELDNIGKLAPTVEREKRGFGMRVP